MNILTWNSIKSVVIAAVVAAVGVALAAAIGAAADTDGAEHQVPIRAVGSNGTINVGTGGN